MNARVYIHIHVHAVEEKIYRTARLVHKKQGGKELCARRAAFRSLIM